MKHKTRILSMFLASSILLMTLQSGIEVKAQPSNDTIEKALHVNIKAGDTDTIEIDYYTNSVSKYLDFQSRKTLLGKIIGATKGQLDNSESPTLNISNEYKLHGDTFDTATENSLKNNNVVETLLKASRGSDICVPMIVSGDSPADYANTPSDYNRCAVLYMENVDNYTKGNRDISKYEFVTLAEYNRNPWDTSSLENRFSKYWNRQENTIVHKDWAIRALEALDRYNNTGDINEIDGYDLGELTKLKDGDIPVFQINNNNEIIIEYKQKVFKTLRNYKFDNNILSGKRYRTDVKTVFDSIMPDLNLHTAEVIGQLVTNDGAELVRSTNMNNFENDLVMTADEYNTYGQHCKYTVYDFDGNVSNNQSTDDIILSILKSDEEKGVWIEHAYSYEIKKYVKDRNVKRRASYNKKFKNDSTDTFWLENTGDNKCKIHIGNEEYEISTMYEDSVKFQKEIISKINTYFDVMRHPDKLINKQYTIKIDDVKTNLTDICDKIQRGEDVNTSGYDGWWEILRGVQYTHNILMSTNTGKSLEYQADFNNLTPEQIVDKYWLRFNLIIDDEIANLIPKLNDIKNSSNYNSFITRLDELSKYVNFGINVTDLVDISSYEKPFNYLIKVWKNGGVIAELNFTGVKAELKTVTAKLKELYTGATVIVDIIEDGEYLTKDGNGDNTEDESYVKNEYIAKQISNNILIDVDGSNRSEATVRDNIKTMRVVADSNNVYKSTTLPLVEDDILDQDIFINDKYGREAYLAGWRDAEYVIDKLKNVNILHKGYKITATPHSIDKGMDIKLVSNEATFSNYYKNRALRNKVIENLEKDLKVKLETNIPRIPANGVRTLGLNNYISANKDVSLVNDYTDILEVKKVADSVSSNSYNEEPEINGLRCKYMKDSIRDKQYAIKIKDGKTLTTFEIKDGNDIINIAIKSKLRQKVSNGVYTDRTVLASNVLYPTINWSDLYAEASSNTADMRKYKVTMEKKADNINYTVKVEKLSLPDNQLEGVPEVPYTPSTDTSTPPGITKDDKTVGIVDIVPLDKPDTSEDEEIEEIEEEEIEEEVDTDEDTEDSIPKKHKKKEKDRLPRTGGIPDLLYYGMGLSLVLSGLFSKKRFRK